MTLNQPGSNLIWREISPAKNNRDAFSSKGRLVLNQRSESFHGGPFENRPQRKFDAEALSDAGHDLRRQQRVSA